MHRMTLGDFELSVFSDGTYPLDGGAFFGVVPKVMWSRKALADEKNFVVAGLNSLLIRTGKQNVLVETGIGNKLSEKMVKIYGQPAKLLDNLAAGGVGPEDIDVVINTHLHFDHCGWHTVQHGDQEIVPGVSVQIFPGHTAHMQAVIVRNGGKTACYISDLIPTSAHLDLTWVMGFDLYPIETINSRQRYYSRALPEKWLTVFTHDDAVPWAYVEKDSSGKLPARVDAQSSKIA